MTALQVAGAKIALHKACARVRAEGWSIAAGVYADLGANDNGVKMCCPMSALIGPDEVAAENDFQGALVVSVASRALGCSVVNVDAFIRGFDREIDFGDDQDPWAQLGRELRAELGS